MKTKIFVNLATKDLVRATKFYQDIGCELISKFTNENASCIKLSDEIYVMILLESFFKSFLPHKNISNSVTSCEVMNGISVDSKDQVNQFMEKVLLAGGNEFKSSYDYGFMYGRAFEDLDGHIREIFWMDENAS